MAYIVFMIYEWLFFQGTRTESLDHMQSVKSGDGSQLFWCVSLHSYLMGDLFLNESLNLSNSFFTLYFKRRQISSLHSLKHQFLVRWVSQKVKLSHNRPVQAQRVLGS